MVRPRRKPLNFNYDRDDLKLDNYGGFRKRTPGLLPREGIACCNDVGKPTALHDSRRVPAALGR